jgi:hypothetical protein
MLLQEAVPEPVQEQETQVDTDENEVAMCEDVPKKSSDAIQRGLAEFEAGDFNAAIDFFTLALEIPGKGSMRFAGMHSPRG